MQFRVFRYDAPEKLDLGPLSNTQSNTFVGYDGCTFDFLSIGHLAVSQVATYSKPGMVRIILSSLEWLKKELLTDGDIIFSKLLLTCLHL